MHPAFPPWRFPMSRTLLALAMSAIACAALARARRTNRPRPSPTISSSRAPRKPRRRRSPRARKSSPSTTRASQRTLREGSNGFTCMPDNPTTPGPDPMCMDAAAMELGERMDVEEATHRRQGRPDVHARRRDGREQHRSLRDRAVEGEPLGGDRPARDGRRRGRPSSTRCIRRTPIPIRPFPTSCGQARRTST